MPGRHGDGCSQVPYEEPNRNPFKYLVHPGSSMKIFHSIVSCIKVFFIFLSVIIAKFPDTYRLFTSEDNKVRYLVILNANNADMFILFHVNEQQDSVVRTSGSLF